MAVAEGRANPKVPSARYAEISNAIQDEKNNLAVFLETDYEPGDYSARVLSFLGRIGHLIGYNVPLPPEQFVEESIQEEETEDETEEEVEDEAVDDSIEVDENVVAIGNHDPMQGIEAELNDDEII